MLTKWNGWGSKDQTNYFIEKDSASALRVHMKQMDQFPAGESTQQIFMFCFTTFCFLLPFCFTNLLFYTGVFPW